MPAFKLEDLIRRWQIDPRLACVLVEKQADIEARVGRQLEIISGYRTCAQQEALERQGRPAAPCDVSTHVSCPATGVDIRLGFAPTQAQKLICGAILVYAGLRWGGGGPVDSDRIPVDWNHFDLGPRYQ